MYINIILNEYMNKYIDRYDMIDNIRFFLGMCVSLYLIIYTLPSNLYALIDRYITFFKSHNDK